MTKAEKEEARLEWLKGVKIGDEVCITDIDNTSSLYTLLYTTKSYDPECVCIISTIRGILDDGCFVIDNDIYTEEGKLIGSHSNQLAGTVVICEPTDKLRNIAWRKKFQESIKEVNWSNIDDEAITEIISSINKAVERKRIIDEQVAKEKEEQARLKAEEDEKRKNKYPIDIADTCSPTIDRMPEDYANMLDRLSALEKIVNISKGDENE